MISSTSKNELVDWWQKQQVKKQNSEISLLNIKRRWRKVKVLCITSNGPQLLKQHMQEFRLSQNKPIEKDFTKNEPDPSA
ncbi:uncharacterized protein CIMG_11770 [Coccidioides immitis RS]|uniref:Uncharacterized protein n=1 Tax=Coccidioides immitis (strain RS) TaxID=246410 RepID=A0A0D8JTI9_COCIM|nr:uncharacterized protein CIMG_11770 [Coccidioides immitis RS]KJF60597.1 hypothetical protein CIMG_11770 [Coccidioides immitis RS]